jgi:hypothetical protein
MKFLGHLLATDVRSFRLLLAACVTALIGAAVFSGIQPLVATNPPLRQTVSVIAGLLQLASILLTIVTAASVVQSHPTVGSDAFWMTRPIPWTALLTSKILLVGFTLVLLPAVTDAAQLAFNGIPFSIGLGVIVQATLFRIFWIGLVAVAAAWTSSLMRFALLVGAVLLSAAVALGIAMTIAMARFDGVDSILVPSFGRDDPTPETVFSALFMLTIGATLIVQYRTRLRRWSILAGTLSLTAAYLMTASWPIPFLEPRLLFPAGQSALAVEVDQATIATNASHSLFSRQQTSWSTVRGLVRISGLDRGWFARFHVREAIVRLEDGRTIAGRGGGEFIGSSGGILLEHSIIRDVLGVGRLAGSAPPRQEPRPTDRAVLLGIRTSDLAPYAPALGEYTARVAIVLTNIIVEGVVPLRRGAAHLNAGYRFSVDDISSIEADVVIQTREVWARSVWERRPSGYFTYYLRNRARREALALSPLDMLDTALTVPLLGFHLNADQSFGFSHRALRLMSPPRYDEKAETIQPDDTWLADAELVILRQTQEGTVERIVEIPGFPLGNIGVPPPTTAGSRQER